MSRGEGCWHTALALLFTVLLGSVHGQNNPPPVAPGAVIDAGAALARAPGESHYSRVALSSASPSSMAADIDALLSFKGNISNWEEFADAAGVEGWEATNSSTDACSWTFVTCSMGRVVSLVINGNYSVSPVGVMSNDLAKLEALQNLSLQGTNLTGTLPPGWGSSSTTFPFLQNLTLSNNDFFGPLPESWGSFGGFNNLTILDLSYNSLTGTLPAAWGNNNAFYSLAGLFLTGNVLTGTLPIDWMGGWASLQELTMDENALTGTLPVEWGLENSFTWLDQLDIANNALTGTLPNGWGNSAGWPVLSWVDLSGNQLTGPLPPSWGSAPSMQAMTNLTLAYNSLTGTLPGSWAAPGMFPILESLKLRGNNLTGELPDSWASASAWSQLIFLDLGQNELTGTLPESWGNVSGAFTLLKGLSLDRNSFTGTLPLVWAGENAFPGLAALALQSNRLSGTLPSYWGNLEGFSYMRRMFLDNNEFVGTLPSSWGDKGSFPLLRLMQLADNQLSGPIPSSWSGLSLTSVWIRPGNDLLCGSVPEGLIVCAEQPTCAPSLSQGCTCDSSATLQYPLCKNGNSPAQAPSDLGPSLIIVLQAAPYTASEFSRSNTFAFTAALQSVLSVQLKSANVLAVQDTQVYMPNPQRRSRALLGALAPELPTTARQLLSGRAPAPAPSVSAVAISPLSASEFGPSTPALGHTSGFSPVNGVNVTMELDTGSSMNSSDAAHDILNATESGALLGAMHTAGFTGFKVVNLLEATYSQAIAPAPAPAPATPVPSSGRRGVSTAVQAVIAVAVALPLLIVVTGVIWWLVRRRRRRAQAQQASKLSGPRGSSDILFAKHTSLHSSQPSSEIPLSTKTSSKSSGAEAARQRDLDLPWSDWEVKPEEVEICQREDGSLWELGHGGFGSVYKGVSNGVTTVAVKVMSEVGAGLNPAKAARQLEAFKREVHILKACHDKNIVQFIGACLLEGRTMLVTEFMEGGDLYQAIQTDSHKEARRFSWYRTSPRGERRVNGLGKRVALDIARGLSFLHGRKIVHFDLKSANILLSRDFTAKLADVGLAKIMRKEVLSTLEGNLGTFAWAAPEVLLGRECTEKVDIFSLGIVFWEISTGDSPDGRRLRPVKVPEECPQEVADLIQRCLDEEPGKRPSAYEVVQFINGLK